MEHIPHIVIYISLTVTLIHVILLLVKAYKWVFRKRVFRKRVSEELLYSWSVVNKAMGGKE